MPEPEPVALPDHGHEDEAIGKEYREQNREQNMEQEADALSQWETRHGKYGLEYLGIHEISKVFPYNAQFAVVDKFIKEEMAEAAYDRTPEAWQKILAGIEQEIGSQNLKAIDRLKRLHDYIQVLKRFRKAKETKDRYLQSKAF